MLVFWGRESLLFWLSGMLDLLKSACRVQVGGVWCKWLKPPLWVLCCSLNSLCADGQGDKNSIDPLSCHHSGKFASSTVQGALTEEQTVFPLVSQGSLRSLPSPSLCPSHLPTQWYSVPVSYLRYAGCVSKLQILGTW